MANRYQRRHGNNPALTKMNKMEDNSKAMKRGYDLGVDASYNCLEILSIMLLKDRLKLSDDKVNEFLRDFAGIAESYMLDGEFERFTTTGQFVDLVREDLGYTTISDEEIIKFDPKLRGKLIRNTEVGAGGSGGTYKTIADTEAEPTKTISEDNSGVTAGVDYAKQANKPSKTIDDEFNQ